MNLFYNLRGRTAFKKRIAAGLIIAASTFSLAQTAHAEKRKLLVGGFEDIVIDGNMQVIITTGKSSSGFATGERRTLDLLKLDRTSEVMNIRVQQPANNETSQRAKEPLVITLSTRNIRNITLRGNATLKIDSMKTDSASRITINGGGSIDIGKITADKIYTNLFGTGKLAIASGTARESRLKIQGAGQYLASGVQTRKLFLDQSGNATVQVRAEESAEIINEGAGTIEITGNAECLIRKADAATITCPQDNKSGRK
jgi:hypothetical protein